MTNAVHDDAGMPERLATIRAAHQRLRTAAESMTEEQTRAAVELPGWTRGHLLIHLADLSRAFARQARYALDGKIIEVYDGGRETRNKSIEANHGQPIEWLRSQLDEGLDALEEAWSKLGPADWQRPCAYRNSPLVATQLAWWRESELHSVDLMTGYHAEQWSPELCAHLIGFLRPRLGDAAVRIVPTDSDQRWEHGGAGEPVTVRGTLTSLAAWISGRPATVLPTADGSAELPELHAWP